MLINNCVFILNLSFVIIMNTVPRYSCSMQELFSCALLGWGSCQQHRAAFVAKKPKYTSVFIDDKIAEIELARNLPDYQQRRSVSEAIRVNLKAKNAQVLEAWQWLKRYIFDAFPPDLHKIKFDAAGMNFYSGASSLDWEDTEALLANASTFITDNLVALLANDIMPPTFQTEFETLRSEFSATHQEFLDSEETSRIHTESKIRANNLIYTDLMAMFQDGQHLFKDNESIKQQFIFEKVLQLVSGSGTAGIKGLILSSEAPNNPVTDATISIFETGEQTTTNQEGRYQISQMAAGTYNLTITAPGFQPQSIAEHPVQIGVMSILNITLIPEPPIT